MGCVLCAVLTYTTVGPTTVAGGSPIHAGIAVALFLAANQRAAWSLFAGVLLSDAWLFGSGYASWPVMLGSALVLAAANSCQGFVAAWLVRRSVGYPSRIDTPRDVALFLVCTGPLSSVIETSLIAAWQLAVRLSTPEQIFHDALRWWSIDTVCVLLVAPLLLVFLGEPAAAWRSKRRGLALPLAIGIVIVMSAYTRTRSLERETAQARFRENAGALAHGLEQELVYLLSAPRSLAQLWLITGHVSRAQFQVAASRMRETHPAIVALEWLPRVRIDQRAQHEALGRTELHAGYAIREFAGDGRAVPAPPRSEYFPIFYLQPETANAAVLGFDLASEPTRAETIARARESGGVSVSRGVRLLQRNDAVPGVLAIAPTVGMFEQPSSAGMIACVIRLDEWLRRAVERAAHGGMVLRIDDMTAPRSEPLAGFNDRPALPTRGSFEAPNVMTKTLQAGDRLWRLSCWETPSFVAANERWHEFARLLRGLLFASLLSALLLLLSGRIAQTEALITERTAELSSINSRLIIEAHTRSQAQLALAASEARWQFALDGADAGVWDWNLESQEAFYSATWRKLFGYAHGEPGPSIAGWHELVHPDDRARCRAEYDWVLSDPGSVFHVEHRMRRTDGREIWTLTRGKVVTRGPDGRARRMIGTQTDITARKAAERELERHRDHLDELVRVRTQDLDHARLSAERADRAKTMFLRNMSHEIRTPLHALLSYAQMGAELADDRSRDYFTRMIGSAMQLHSLLGNLLELSSLGSEQGALNKAICDLRTLVSTVARELQTGLAPREQQIVVADEGPVVSTTLEADPMRVATVFRQLLLNAGRYSPTGTTIRVEFARLPALEASGDDMLEVRVIDQGVGIAPDELELIFESFVQGSRTRNNAGGTGLGLAICREIVVQHGGSIRAVNNLDGIGTSFIVCLPAPHAFRLPVAS